MKYKDKYIYILLIIIICLLSILYSNNLENFQNNTTINFYNSMHLGDCVFLMIYLYNCKQYIIDNNITINYYINSQYIDQVKEFICCPNINILDITKHPQDAIDTWINSSKYKLNHDTMGDLIKAFNEFLAKFLSQVGSLVNLPPMLEFSYTDENLLSRYNNFKDIYKNNDILIINSNPQSLQYDYEATKISWINMINKLSEKYKLVTTNKIENIPCTMDDNLTIKDIAAISTSVKYIIAINVGPLVGCFNTYALNNVNKWYIMDNRVGYSYDNFYMNKSFDEILNDLL